MPEISKQDVGELIKYWRRQRRFSQLELSHECGSSARHLSFVETGRAAPSRQLLLSICAALEVPLRARNTILIAAGYAPYYQDTGLSDPEMAEARAVLERILFLHSPNPAMLIDRCWNIVMHNDAFRRLVDTFSGSYGTEREGNWNLLRLLFHPDGWSKNIANLDEVYASMMERGRRSLIAGDENAELAHLLEEISDYCPREHQLWSGDKSQPEGLPKLILPVHYIRGDLEVHLFTTVATLGAPLNITLQELQIECGYPMDEASEAFFNEG